MKVINLFGGPGVGKSTLAAALFVLLKKAGYDVEMSREQAKELLYRGHDLPKSQMLITALQYQHLKGLEKAGTKVAVCDGPIRQSAVYVEGLLYGREMLPLLDKLAGEFDNVNVLLRRAVPYHAHARNETAGEAALLSTAIDVYLAPFDIELPGPDPDALLRALQEGGFIGQTLLLG